MRTDPSCTVFLCEPQDYDGGELVMHGTAGSRMGKLRAGHAVLHPGSSVHEELPVTRGERPASLFWIESMVHSSEQRRLLLDFDDALMALRGGAGDDETIVAQTGALHNLLRMWAYT